MTSEQEIKYRRSILSAGVICMAIVIIGFMLMGCATPITDQRSYGQAQEASAWNNIPSMDYVCEEFDMGGIKVRFYHPDYMPPCGDVYNPAGCAGGSWINVKAKKTPHGFIPIQYIMGHEVLHILNQAGYPVVNPDKLKLFGY